MQRYIDPKTLARVKDMPLIAKTVADGFLHGLHQSVQRGVGIEFSQYRAYEDGDDLSRIDWKLFARSDRYFVREAERESEIAIWFVLDASASMAVGSDKKSDQSNWTKLEYAKHLIATLAYLAYRQGDRIGLVAVSSDEQHIIPLGAGERHWSRMLRQLARVKSGAVFPSKNIIRSSIAKLQQPGAVFIVSDFYQHDDEILDFTRQIAIGHTDASAIQVQCDDEIEFPYKGAVRFEDAETSEQILVSAQGAREIYKEALNEHQHQLQQNLLRQNIPLSTFNIDKPMDRVLYDFIKNRAKVLR